MARWINREEFCRALGKLGYTISGDGLIWYRPADKLNAEMRLSHEAICSTGELYEVLLASISSEIREPSAVDLLADLATGEGAPGV